MPKMFLPDVNVWLALTFDSHTHHPDAKTWFDGLTDEVCFFCRMTQQGFLRLATNRQVFGTNALTLDEAWQSYDTYRSDPRTSFADEPANVETPWRTFTHGQSFSHHVWNDAYLAAYAQAGGYEVVTFDKGFHQYPSIACTILG
jgi:toxin-antitoxin system PIN domain toxin